MYWPDIAEIGRTAEEYVYSDPNACMYKLGLLGERIVAEILSFEGIATEEESSQADRLKLLRQRGILPYTIDNLFYSIRKARNDAVHAQLNDPEQAMTLLRMAHSLSLWFMEVYGDGVRREEPFVPPTDRSEEEDFNERMRQQEKLIDELLSQVGEI
jgi:type I restriction enzyme R subunit